MLKLINFAIIPIRHKPLKRGLADSVIIKFPSNDVFVKNTVSDKGVKMSFDEQFEKIKKSEKMQTSPVSFLIKLFSDYVEKKITVAELSDSIDTETKKAQYAFSRMSERDIAHFQEFFKKEFEFADKVNKVMDSALGSEDKMKAIETFMEEYEY